jgi:hypothetical protein
MLDLKNKVSGSFFELNNELIIKLTNSKSIVDVSRLTFLLQTICVKRCLTLYYEIVSYPLCHVIVRIMA